MCTGHTNIPQSSKGSVSPKGSTTPKTTRPNTLDANLSTRTSSQVGSKIQKVFRNWRWTFFNLTQTGSVVTRLNRQGFLSENNPTHLRTFLQQGFQVSNTGCKEIHTTTECPESQIEILQGVVRSGAHASSPGAERWKDQEDEAQGEWSKGTATAGWIGGRDQVARPQRSSKKGNPQKIQQQTKEGRTNHNTQGTTTTKTVAGQRKTTRPDCGQWPQTWSLRGKR